MKMKGIKILFCNLFANTHGEIFFYSSRPTQSICQNRIRLFKRTIIDVKSLVSEFFGCMTKNMASTKTKKRIEFWPFLIKLTFKIFYFFKFMKLRLSVKIMEKIKLDLKIIL
jgi:hypothetical protein